MNLSLTEIAKTLETAPPSEAEAAATGYSIDTRRLRPGDLYFAIAGESRDGHEFARAALEAGAAAVVVSRAGTAPGRELIVPDTLHALQRLAHAVRRRWPGQVIGVTGSAGKTTTKEMIAAVLATRYRVLKNAGNLNNHLGVPLTLLRLEPEHELAVIEMGMNHAGEIARLAAMAEPAIGVFTNVGAAHLGNFDSIEGIAAAKRELAEALPPSGAMVLNADDPRVSRFGEGFAGRVRFYRGADFHGRLQYLGEHNRANAAAAVTTGELLGIAGAAPADALARLEPPPGRGRRIDARGLTLLDDCYNANPEAMKQMLRVLALSPGVRHIAVLGEMRELGAAASAMHRRVGAAAAAVRLDVLVGVGPLAKDLLAGAREAGFAGEMVWAEDAPAAGVQVAARARSGDVILFKASRGIGLERALTLVRGGD